MNQATEGTAHKVPHNPNNGEPHAISPARPDPLSARLPPKVVRITLDAAQSAALAAAGVGAFTIISRQSYPGDPSRWIVTVAPADWQRARSASSVLLETHRAVKA